MATDAPDTNASAQVTDHPYISTDKHSFLCDTCGLGQATHNHPDSQNYVPIAETYRCPDCVISGKEICTHKAL